MPQPRTNPPNSGGREANPSPTAKNHRSNRFWFELAMICLGSKPTNLNSGDLDTGGGKDLDGSRWNLARFRWISSKSGWISSRFGLIWPNLSLERGGIQSGQLDLVFMRRLVNRLAEFGFWKWKSAVNGWSVRFQSKLVGLGEWVGLRVRMDNPRKYHGLKYF